MKTVSREDLNVEYSKLCSKLGHYLYQADKVKADIEKIQQQANALAVQDALIQEAIKKQDQERAAAIQAAIAEGERKAAVEKAAQEIIAENAPLLDKLRD